MAGNEQCSNGNAITLEHALEEINMFLHVGKNNNSLKRHISEHNSISQCQKLKAPEKTLQRQGK